MVKFEHGFPFLFELDEMLVYVGQQVKEGDYLATVESASVMKAM